ncbi:MAG: Aspartyl protease [Planctomycetota bacterium]|nr:Aspartyl protease [Planctomycetota bacterium]
MAILTKPIERYGPLVEVAVNMDERFASKRRAVGLPTVMPHVCLALADTGASRSLIDHAVIAALGLESIGLIELATASTGGERKSSRAFLVRMTIALGARSMATTVTAVESDLGDFGVGAILGRDFLARGLLVYNGPSGEFTIAF